MSVIDEPVSASLRPFPLAPRFGYGGFMKLHTGEHVSWSDEGAQRSGTVQEIHSGPVTRVFGGSRQTCRGTIEDKALLVMRDDTGEPTLINESQCRRRAS